MGWLESSILGAALERTDGTGDRHRPRAGSLRPGQGTFMMPFLDDTRRHPRQINPTVWP
jgi:hypothetical protein